MIGERIRQARLLAGLSQEALAQALTEAGYSATQAVISAYEIGERMPKPSLLGEMSRILAVDAAYFAGDERAGQGVPSASELLGMPTEERERWMQRAFDLATDEAFDAYGEEEF